MLDPNHAIAKNELALACSQLRNTFQDRENISAYNSVNTPRNPDYLFYYRQGNAHYQAGNRETAIENYNNAIRLNYNFSDVYSRRGKAYYDIGYIQAAIHDFNTAILLDPNHTIAKQDLELACSNLKNILPKSEHINVLDLHIIRSHVGQTISVKGKIVGAYIDKENNTIYFDFAQNVSDGFFAYVPTSSFRKFQNPTTYIGSNVAVFGRISLDRNNQLCIYLNEDWQLRKID